VKHPSGLNTTQTDSRGAQMRKSLAAMFILAVAGCVFGAAAAPAAQTEWLSREFTNTWNVPGKSAEEFLNNECRPSGLDGIQMYAVQGGHADDYHLHLYCRHDQSETARYKVTLPEFPRGKMDSVVLPLLNNPNVRIGPFYFGKADTPNPKDGLLMIEKTK
jgi:hypothetical protein